MDLVNYSSENSSSEENEKITENSLKQFSGTTMTTATQEKEESFIAYNKKAIMDCEDSTEERGSGGSGSGASRNRLSPAKSDKEKRSRDDYEEKHKSKSKYEKTEFRSKERDNRDRYKNRDKRSDRYYKDNKYRDDSRKSDRYYKDYREKDRRGSDDKYRSHRHEDRDRRRRSSSKERRHKERSKDKRRSYSKSPQPTTSNKKPCIEGCERKEIKPVSSPQRSSNSGASGDEMPMISPTFLPLAPPPIINRNQLAKASDGTPVELPSYYNPNVINVNKYAEQVQKRKLLWSGKKEETATVTANKWNNAKFSQDNDGKVSSKFMRLMGIKNASGPSSETETPAAPPKTSEDMFNTMERQYEVARAVTHSYRGVGLGFAKPF